MGKTTNFQNKLKATSQAISQGLWDVVNAVYQNPIFGSKQYAHQFIEENGTWLERSNSFSGNVNANPTLREDLERKLNSGDLHRKYGVLSPGAINAYGFMTDSGEKPKESPEESRWKRAITYLAALDPTLPYRFNKSDKQEIVRGVAELSQQYKELNTLPETALPKEKDTVAYLTPQQVGIIVDDLHSKAARAVVREIAIAAGYVAPLTPEKKALRKKKDDTTENGKVRALDCRVGDINADGTWKYDDGYNAARAVKPGAFVKNAVRDGAIIGGALASGVGAAALAWGSYKATSAVIGSLSQLVTKTASRYIADRHLTHALASSGGSWAMYGTTALKEAETKAAQGETGDAATYLASVAGLVTVSELSDYVSKKSEKRFIKGAATAISGLADIALLYLVGSYRLHDKTDQKPEQQESPEKLLEKEGEKDIVKAEKAKAPEPAQQQPAQEVVQYDAVPKITELIFNDNAKNAIFTKGSSLGFTVEAEDDHAIENIVAELYRFNGRNNELVDSKTIYPDNILDSADQRLGVAKVSDGGKFTHDETGEYSIKVKVTDDKGQEAVSTTMRYIIVERQLSAEQPQSPQPAPEVAQYDTAQNDTGQDTGEPAPTPQPKIAQNTEDNYSPDIFFTLNENKPVHAGEEFSYGVKVTDEPAVGDQVAHVKMQITYPTESGIAATLVERYPDTITENIQHMLGASSIEEKGNFNAQMPGQYKVLVTAEDSRGTSYATKFTQDFSVLEKEAQSSPQPAPEVAEYDALPTIRELIFNDNSKDAIFTKDSSLGFEIKVKDDHAIENIVAELYRFNGRNHELVESKTIYPDNILDSGDQSIGVAYIEDGGDFTHNETGQYFMKVKVTDDKGQQAEQYVPRYPYSIVEQQQEAQSPTPSAPEQPQPAPSQPEAAQDDTAEEPTLVRLSPESQEQIMENASKRFYELQKPDEKEEPTLVRLSPESKEQIMKSANTRFYELLESDEEQPDQTAISERQEKLEKAGVVPSDAPPEFVEYHFNDNNSDAVFEAGSSLGFEVAVQDDYMVDTITAELYKIEETGADTKIEAKDIYPDNWLNNLQHRLGIANVEDGGEFTINEPGKYYVHAVAVDDAEQKSYVQLLAPVGKEYFTVVEPQEQVSEQAQASTPEQPQPAPAQPEAAQDDTAEESPQEEPTLVELSSKSQEQIMENASKRFDGLWKPGEREQPEQPEQPTPEQPKVYDPFTTFENNISYGTENATKVELREFYDYHDTKIIPEGHELAFGEKGKHIDLESTAEQQLFLNFEQDSHNKDIDVDKTVMMLEHYSKETNHDGKPELDYRAFVDVDKEGKFQLPEEFAKYEGKDVQVTWAKVDYADDGKLGLEDFASVTNGLAHKIVAPEARFDIEGNETDVPVHEKYTIFSDAVAQTEALVSSTQNAADAIANAKTDAESQSHESDADIDAAVAANSTTQPAASSDDVAEQSIQSQTSTEPAKSAIETSLYTMNLVNIPFHETYDDHKTPLVGEKHELGLSVDKKEWDEGSVTLKELDEHTKLNNQSIGIKSPETVVMLEHFSKESFNNKDCDYRVFVPIDEKGHYALPQEFAAYKGKDVEMTWGKLDYKIDDSGKITEATIEDLASWRSGEKTQHNGAEQDSNSNVANAETGKEDPKTETQQEEPQRRGFFQWVGDLFSKKKEEEEAIQYEPQNFQINVTVDEDKPQADAEESLDEEMQDTALLQKREEEQQRALEEEIALLRKKQTEDKFFEALLREQQGRSAQQNDLEKVLAA